MAWWVSIEEGARLNLIKLRHFFLGYVVSCHSTVTMVWPFPRG